MTRSMRNSRRYAFSALLMFLFLLPLVATAQEKPAAKPPSNLDAPRYKDASRPIDARVADLLGRMTLEEKVDQIATGWENKVDVNDPTGTCTTAEARKMTLGEWPPDVKLTPRNSAILRNGVHLRSG